MWWCSCYGVCLFILYRFPVTTGQSNLICSSEPVISLAGDDVILPCRLEPPISSSSKTVEWTRPGLDPEYIHIHQDGRLVYQSQNPLYNYRTILFVDQMIHGNVSLKIFSVKISDAGRYKCFLPWLWKESFIQLSVGAVSSPVISLAGVDESSSGVVLRCKSEGWHPEPEVLWLDGEGNVLSAGPTETVRGPDDLYTVSSRVTVVKRHGNTFTCRVQQQRIKQTKVTEIHVPDDFFMGPCECPANVGVIVLVVCLLVAAVAFAVAFGVWRCRRTKKKTETVQDPQTEKDKGQTSKSNKTTKETKPLMEPKTKPKNVINKTKQPEIINTISSDRQDLPTNSQVVVDEIDLNGKYICLRNTSGENQILGNWKVSLEVSETSLTYKFPPGFILGDTGTVKIWASDAGHKHDPPEHLLWETQKSWSTKGTMKATLTSPMGETMHVKEVEQP